MGQTRVDLLHLLEDLRDAYPGGLDETIVAETVANALDSEARHVAFVADPAERTLTITDDGSGMSRAQLRRYHDLASSTKRRGRGIGFAGVGIKLALLECDEVITETRRGDTVHATRWRLASRQKAPWEYMKPPPGIVPDDNSGTAVRLTLNNPLATLLDPGWLAAALIRGFTPLFDPTFDEILGSAYPDGVRFSVNGRTIPRAVGASARLLGDTPLIDRADFAAKLPRKRKPSALGWLARSDEPLPEAERGIAVSTLGKVIVRGWDWLGISPAAGDRITGLIEAPGLAEALQLNKAEFIRTGSRGGVYLAYRKAIQEGVTAQLMSWGETPPGERARRPRTRPIERDLEHVLIDMADAFPLLGALVERRAGGQRRIRVGRPADGAADADWAPAAGIAGTPPEDEVPPGEEPGAGPDEEGAEPEDGAPEPSSPPQPPERETGGGALPGRAGRKKRGRYTLDIRFESRGAEQDMARLVESTVWVNDQHPAWRRAEASRAEGYHIALCVAMALAPLAAEADAAHAFITAFMAHWGEAAGKGKKGRGRGKGRRGTA